MEKLCTSCTYPENECLSCNIIQNYLTSLPEDCTFLQDSKNTPLRELIMELKEEVHTLTLELEEIKKTISK